MKRIISILIEDSENELSNSDMITICIDIRHIISDYLNNNFNMKIEEVEIK